MIAGRGGAKNRGLAETGFTIIELMIVMLVAAAILVFGVPAFIGVINNNRVTTAVNDLQASVSLARTEAIKNNTTARVMPVPPSTDWKQGYDIRVDRNSDGDYLDSDEVIRIVDPVNDSIEFCTYPASMYFNSLGGLGLSLFVSSVTDFTLRADRAFERVLKLTPSGAGTISVGSTVERKPLCP